jgi:glycosyltransferase involved in cell wall biosynthesis
MQYGKAIVATDLPVFQEHLRNLHNALLIPYGDETALAEALLELIQSPSYREQLAHALHERSQPTMSWAAIADRTIDCYRSLAK